MTNSILFVFLSFLLLIACAKPDKSILVKEGDDLLDCRALANEFEFAKNFGANASSRRRHIKVLQEKKQCIIPPEVDPSAAPSPAPSPWYAELLDSKILRNLFSSSSSSSSSSSWVGEKFFMRRRMDRKFLGWERKFWTGSSGSECHGTSGPNFDYVTRI